MDKSFDYNDLIKMELSASAANKVIELWNRHDGVDDCLNLWKQLCQHVLDHTIAFEIHQSLHERVFLNWSSSLGPKPAWSPTKEQIQESNLGTLIAQKNFNSLEQFYQWTIDQPSAFIELMLDRLEIIFDKKPQHIITNAQDIEAAQFLPHAQINIVNSCFSAPKEFIAIKTQNSDGSITEITYGDLYDRVGQVVNGLKSRGVQPGDRVGLALPVSANAVAAYLGIIAAGCSAVTVAESFSKDEMEVRFDLTQPVCVLTQDTIQRQGKEIPLYEKVALATNQTCIVLFSSLNDKLLLRNTDSDWDDFLSPVAPFTIESCQAQDEITVLFSSGTTGNPKAIPLDHSAPLKSANDGHLHHDLKPADVVCWPTSLGWMMGPWLVFTSLINKSTIALNNDAPTTREFGVFVQHAAVTMLGLVPSIVSAWRSSDCMRGLDWQHIRAFSSTGECSNQEDMLFLMSLANYKPIIEYCGGTETAGAYISGSLIQANAPGTFSTPAMGSSWCILDDNGVESTTGEVFFQAPALGLSNILINGNHHHAYFKDCPAGKNGNLLRRHGDQLEHITGSYYRAHGRMDDSMNLGGIKVSSVQVEELLQNLESVIESAAIEVPPPGGGPGKLVIYAVLSKSSDCLSLKKSMQKILRQQLNPLFKIHDVIAIDRLPRTASNKVMRRQLRHLYDN